MKTYQLFFNIQYRVFKFIVLKFFEKYICHYKKQWVRAKIIY